MRASRLSVTNYNTTLSSDSLETGTGSSNSLRSTSESSGFGIHFRQVRAAVNSRVNGEGQHRRMVALADLSGSVQAASSSAARPYRGPLSTEVSVCAPTEVQPLSFPCAKRPLFDQSRR